MKEQTDYLSDPKLNSKVKEFLRLANAGARIETLGKEQAREVLIGVQMNFEVDTSGVEVTERVVCYEGKSVGIHVIRPQGVKETLPVIIFIHGGGWVLGDFVTHKRMVRDLVLACGFAVVFVNYSPSPEVRFPVAINEIYAVTKWVANNGHEINVNGKKMAIAGNSVGGNMALVTALKAREECGPKISSLILFWPVADASFDSESYREFGNDRFLTTSLMQWMFDQYTSNGEIRNNEHISPLLASREKLQFMPPTLIQLAENDILRDGGEALGRKMEEAGAEVTTIRYNGVIHDFGLLNGLAKLPATRTLFLHAGAELKKRLG